MQQGLAACTDCGYGYWRTSTRTTPCAEALSLVTQMLPG